MVEFAFIMPLFLLIIVTILETAFQFLVGVLLNTGLDEASRAIMLGKIKGSDAKIIEKIRDVIEDNIGFLAGEKDNIHILLKKPLNLQTVSFQPPTDQKGDFDPSKLDKTDSWKKKDIVFLTLYYKFPLSTGVLDFFRNRSRKNYSVITTTRIIKIEPL